MPSMPSPPVTNHIAAMETSVATGITISDVFMHFMHMIALRDWQLTIGPIWPSVRINRMTTEMLMMTPMAVYTTRAIAAVA